MKVMFDHQIHEIHRIEHVFDKVIPLLLHHFHRDQLKFRRRKKIQVFHFYWLNSSLMIYSCALYKQYIPVNFKWAIIVFISSSNI
jgi:hypothetical protein